MGLSRVMSKYLFMIVMLLTIGSVVPMSDTALMAADKKTSAQSQRQKQAEQKAKQRERQRAQTQKAREQKAKQRAREKEQADKQRAREQERKEKAQAKKDERNEQESYNKQIEQIKKHNKRAISYQTRDIHHYVGVWGFAGYSALFQKFDTQLNFVNKTVGGFGGGAGVGYQMLYKHFLFNAGLEFEQFNSLDRIVDNAAGAGSFTQSFPMSPYPTMTYTYIFNDLTTRTSASYLQIPLLFGGEWDRYYFLAGPKVGMSIAGKSATSAMLTTQITDDEFIGPIDQMFTHALVENRPYNSKPDPITYSPLRFGLNVGLHGEFGIYLDEWIKKADKNKKPQVRGGKKQDSFADRLRYRIGLFADYGVLNIQSGSNISSNSTVPVTFNNAQDPLDLTMQPILSIEPSRNAKVNPFLVGVKVAVFCELPRKQVKILPFPPEPMPRMAARIVSEADGTPLTAAMLMVYSTERDRVITKTTSRGGMVVQKFKRGEYKLWAKRSGYYDSDTVTYTLESDLKDTVIFRLKQLPEPPKYYMTGFVRDSETLKPLEASISIFDGMGKTKLYEGQAADDGLFVTDLEKGDYIAHLTMPGYSPADDTIHFDKDTVYLTMTPIKEGMKVVLHNMFFATNKTQILSESEQALEFLYSFLDENPTVEVLITGHTDAVGSEASNQRLSEGRSKAVREALIMRGIDGARIETDGKGESEPIADNETEEGRAMNRRVEITITSTGGKDIEVQVVNK